MSEAPNITVPRHLAMFSQAVKPIMARLAHAVAYPWSGSTRPARPDDLRAIGADLSHALAQLEIQIHNLMEEVLTQPDALETAIHRQVGRFEGAAIDPLLKAHGLAQTLRGGQWDPPATLVRRGIIGLIKQLHAWLADMVEVLEHPAEAYRKRSHTMEGDVAMFTFDLNLAVPPEWEELRLWTERQQRNAQVRGDDFSLRIEIDTVDQTPKPPPPKGHSSHMTRTPIAALPPAAPSNNNNAALVREQAELSKTLTSMIKLMGWFMLFESFYGD
ncbi:MAG: hypothetical protein ACKN9W_14330 [Methylococcus sp.]